MFLWIILFTVITVVVGTVYSVIKHSYCHWTRLGVKGPKPKLLQFGNLFQLTSHPNPPVNEIELVQRYGSIYGTYVGLQPVLTVAEPEWIKRIMVKDFQWFVNRRQLRVHHEFVSVALFFADSDQWKRVRRITSPAFSTGKLRTMHSLMDRCLERLANRLQSVANGEDTMSTKQVIAGGTIDVISSILFATEIDQSVNVTSNPLLKHALEINNVGLFQALSYWTMPKWFNKLVGVKHFLNDTSLNFILSLSEEILKKRRVDTTKRNDMLQLLIDAYANEEELQKDDYDQLTADMDTETQMEETKQSDATVPLSDTEILAQVLNFLVAGFDTSSATISNCIFELSHHPTIQERLHQELHEKLHGLEEHSDEYYDTVMHHLPYCDAVVKETLRKYPPLIRLERRVSVDDYKVADIALHRNQLVEISIVAVHYNHEFYPEPYHFKPNRFLPENKHCLVPYTYLPFGLGPRNCIGMRFAYQVIKFALAKIVRRFRFVPGDPLETKIRFETFRFGLHAKPFTTKVLLR